MDSGFNICSVFLYEVGSGYDFQNVVGSGSGFQNMVGSGFYSNFEKKLNPDPETLVARRICDPWPQKFWHWGLPVNYTCQELAFA